jgi:flagellar biosynthetic protein FlhB
VPEEYAGEKTEQPTPRKRQEARKRGQVARSQDLNTSVVLIAVFVVLNLTAGPLLDNLKFINTTILGSLASVHLTIDTIPHYILSGFVLFMQMLLPVLGAVVVMAVLVNLAQVGLVISGEPMKPDLNNINPIKGLKRIFSLRSLMRLAMSLGKLAIIGSVLVLTALGELDSILMLFEMPIDKTITYSGYIVFLLGIRAALALLVISIFDYGYQRWEMERELRMTRQELRDELKRMEGDPKIKERRRAVQRQLALQRMMAAVPKAQVVVTNPTEIAVALAYEADDTPAPTVVAKGAGFMAQRIRDEAASHGVPIVEKKPLAQALFKSCEVGDEIPPELFQAVAEVLAYVYEISGRMPHAARVG